MVRGAGCGRVEFFERGLFGFLCPRVDSWTRVLFYRLIQINNFCGHTRYGRLVDHAVLAFVNSHHHDDQHVILYAIDQLAALLVALDLVVPRQRIEGL